MNDESPFAPPTATSGANAEAPPLSIDPRDKKKLDAVLQDAGQFWLAIILCFLCSGIAAFVVPLWYTIRLLQWNRLGNKYPALKTPGAPPKSIQAKFQAAQWKLIVGLVFGCMIFLVIAAYIAMLFLIRSSAI